MNNDLTKGSPAKVILLFSIPIIIGNIFQQGFFLVDTILVGRLISYQALAGVGITGGITFISTGLVLGITSGVTIRTAQYFGAGDMAGVRRSMGTSIWICLALTLLMMVAAVFAGPMLRAMSVGEDIFAFGRDYLAVVFLGIIAPVAYNLSACLLRAIGDSRTPLYFLIAGSVLNIVLDILLISTFGMGVVGAALASVLAQGMTAIVCFIYSCSKYEIFRLSIGDFRTSLGEIAGHLRIAVPMALQFAITGVGLVMLQTALGAFPSSYIAGFTAANKIQNVGVLVASALGVAMATYAGQNYGAGDMGRIRKGFRSTMWITMGVCIVSSAALVLFADQFTGLFIGDGLGEGAGEILLSSRKYLYVSAAFFPFLFALLIYRNVLQGMGRTFWPLMAGVLELAVRAVGSLTLPRFFGYDGLILIDALAWIAACLLLSLCYHTSNS